MSSNYEQLISIYRNTPTISALIEILKQHNSPSSISIGWHINEDIWVIYTEDSCKYVKLHANTLTNKTHPFYKMFLDIPNVFITDEKYLHMLEVFIYKLASEDLLRRSKMKHAFVISSICDIIKSPLSVILHNIKSHDNVKENNSVLKHTMINLANGIFDILDLHKLEMGTLTLEPSIFNVSDMINQIRNTVATFDICSSVAINYYIDKSVPDTIYTDIKRLKQIIVSLMRNSVQHTFKGEINLCLYANIVSDEENKKAANGQLYNIIIEVSDTGVGIDERTSEHIFKPLDVVEIPMGISLRLCYLLSKKFGGDLTFNTQIGKGTCFGITICVHEKQIPIISTLAVLKNKHVLVIDNSNEKITICSVLNQNEMEFICASMYEEIFILYSKKRFDLVIINMSMKDSIKIYEQCKKTWNTKYIAICDDNHSVNIEFDDVIRLHSEEDAYKVKLWEIFA
jgi:hypothetical protein